VRDGRVSGRRHCGCGVLYFGVSIDLLTVFDQLVGEAGSVALTVVTAPGTVNIMTVWKSWDIWPEYMRPQSKAFRSVSAFRRTTFGTSQ
jgi:hypothetical protein